MIRKTLFGAHESVAGGLHTAFERIETAGGQALQIFTRNQRQWNAAPISSEESLAFRNAWEHWGDYPVASHASYLLNPASPDAILRKRSADALAQELIRCRVLGIPWVVLHPGSRQDSPLEDALRHAAATMDDALEQSGESGPLILLENTAGQGSGLGARLGELAAIIDSSRHKHRFGLCLDTCHAFAAGYDVRTRAGIDALLAELERGRLRLMHVNDSKGALGSRLDRHEHIGQGQIGTEGFKAVVTHPVLSALPMVLETHKEKDLKEDVANLRLLRELSEAESSNKS